MSLRPEESIPPYVISNNQQLAEVAKARPETLAALSSLEGFGDTKLNFPRVLLC